MEEMAGRWSYEEMQNVDWELKEKVAYTSLELEQLKAKTIEEVAKNKEYATRLFQRLKIAIQERDEAIFHLQYYVKKLSAVEANSPQSAITFVPTSTNANANANRITMENDRGSLVIEKLIAGRLLPEKGKLQQAVKDATQMLQTQLIAGSLPRWRNPPPPLVSCAESSEFLDSFISTCNYGNHPSVKRQRLY